MSIPSALSWLSLALLALFAGLNWPAIVAPVPLSLGVTDVQAPLGLILLGVSVLLCGVFAAYVLVLQASALLESRRMAKDLHAQSALADKAEASRFTRMGTLVETQVRSATEQQLAALGRLSERVERLEQVLKQSQGESTSTLSAYIGEVEDKLDRVLSKPDA